MLQINGIISSRQLNILCCVAACFILSCLVAKTLPSLPEPIGSRSSIFIAGANVTVMLSLASGILGLIIGIGFGFGKLSSSIWLRNISTCFVWLLRGTPLLMQILFVYYVFSLWLPWLKLNEFNSALIALSLNVSAYNAEVIRAGILAIPKGQTEAGIALGMSRYRILRHIVFPQAFSISIPALINNFIALIKDSSLASCIGLLELSLSGTRIVSETFDPIPVLATVALIYLVLTSFVSIIIYFIYKSLSFST